MIRQRLLLSAVSLTAFVFSRLPLDRACSGTTSSAR